jgi:sulfur-carrier protein adenylyltransferase/sulfurtransferase
MAIRVLIPTPLRPFTDKQDAVDVNGSTVGELLADLTRQYGGLKKHLYTDDGRLRSFVNVYVNDEDIRYLQKEQTPVKAGDTVSIIPSVAGGSGAAVSEELPSLSALEIKRYSRHLILPEVGVDGQRKLKASSVLCIGAGGLGSPVALVPRGCRRGRIGIVDYDVVDYSNLQRQILHGTADVGNRSCSRPRRRCRRSIPRCTSRRTRRRCRRRTRCSSSTATTSSWTAPTTFPTRYLVNDACVLGGIPNAYGSIFRFEGQASVFAADNGPCYRCLYPEPPPPGLVPSCAEGGVLGVLPGIIGMIQATEALKLMLGIGEPLIGRFVIFDALKMKFREMKLRKDPDCPVCGTHPTVTSLIDYEQFCGVAPEPATTGSQTSDAPREITAIELKERLDHGDRLVVLDVREPQEYQINRIDGSALIPLGELPQRYQELDPSTEIVAQCKSGMRSAKAADFLRQKGYRVSNLKGGILGWIDAVDPSQPKY